MMTSQMQMSATMIQMAGDAMANQLNKKNKIRKKQKITNKRILN